MVCTVGHPCLPIPSPAKPDASLLRGQPVLRLATDQHIGPVNSSHAVRGSTAAQVRLAVVTASFKSQEDRDKWVGDLKAAAPGSRDEAGTLSYQLSIGVKDALKVVIIERCVRPAQILAAAPSSSALSVCCRCVEGHRVTRADMGHSVAVRWYMSHRRYPVFLSRQCMP